MRIAPSQNYGRAAVSFDNGYNSNQTNTKVNSPDVTPSKYGDEEDQRAMFTPQRRHGNAATNYDRDVFSSAKRGGNSDVA